MMERWKRLSRQGNGHDFLMNFNAIDKTSYELKVSNLNSVWQEMLTAPETEDRCKKLNPRLEVTLTSVIEHIRNTLESEEINILSINHDSPNLVKIEMCNDFAGGIPFKWEFLCKISEEKCHNVFLQPIARLIMSLQVANNKLVDIIQKKDDEIKDYKEFSGATVSRPYLETEQFEMEKFSDRLRRCTEYQSEINKDVMSILTLQSVNDRIVELEKDISSPMTILNKDTKDRNAQAKIKGQTRTRRKNVRAPAKGVEIESDQDDVSEEDAAKPRVVLKRSATTAASKSSKKKKTADRRRNLF